MIILCILGYIIVAILTFIILSKIDIFDEYKYNYCFEFPNVTFCTSLFWIIILPILGLGYLFEFIGEWISIWGYVFYEKSKNKKKGEKIK